MPKYVKKDYTDSLDEFFGKVNVKIDWSKLTLTDLEKLCGVLDDNDKVIELFGLAEMVDKSTPDDAGGLGGLLDGSGDIREKLGRVADGAVDGAMETLKRERPLRSQIGSGQLLNRIMQMVGKE